MKQTKFDRERKFLRFLNFSKKLGKRMENGKNIKTGRELDLEEKMNSRNHDYCIAPVEKLVNCKQEYGESSSFG